jgi:hypothetical protein
MMEINPMQTSINQIVLCTVLSLSLLLSMIPVPSAAGGIVTTSDALTLESQDPQTTLEAWLQREDVAQELTALGVSPEMAWARVQALSPDEVAAMAERIAEMPAGGGVIEVLGVTFLVLLILHLTGVLKVFR